MLEDSRGFFVGTAVLSFRKLGFVLGFWGLEFREFQDVDS